MWLISTRPFWPRLHQNHLAMCWQSGSHRVQPDRALQAGCPVVIKSQQVLINGTGQAIEFRHLQHVVTQMDDVTIGFQEVDLENKSFYEGIGLSKSVKPKFDIIFIENWATIVNILDFIRKEMAVKYLWSEYTNPLRDWLIHHNLHLASIFLFGNGKLQVLFRQESGTALHHPDPTVDADEGGGGPANEKQQ